jgi:hypothetical protein
MVDKRFEITSEYLKMFYPNANYIDKNFFIYNVSSIDEPKNNSLIFVNSLTVTAKATE